MSIQGAQVKHIIIVCALTHLGTYGHDRDLERKEFGMLSLYKEFDSLCGLSLLRKDASVCVMTHIRPFIKDV